MVRQGGQAKFGVASLMATACYLAFPTSVVWAQTMRTTSPGASTTVPEVIVTATKRSQSVQQVPFTVTALGQADLTARGAQSVDQAINFVPGVNFSSNGANSGSYSVRGVSTSSYVENTQSPVALYIDDINILDPSYPKVTTNLRLFDTNRVEVLEGPQGTLFGSGSLGGAIRVITNKPDTAAYEAETEDTVSGTRGGELSYDFNVMANVPIIRDKLALRVVGYYQSDGGYVDNITTGQKNVNHSISQGGRLELKWAPTSDLTLIGSVLIQNDRPHDTAYMVYSGKQYVWNGYLSNTSYNDTKIYSLSATYDLHWAALTSITTYADRNESVVADFTQDAAAKLGTIIPSPIIDAGPSHTFSQELRLASPGADRFRWLVGGIYIDNRRTVNETVTVPGSGALFGVGSDVVSEADSNGRVREVAGFGELAYDLTPRLTATAGVRVFNDELVTHQTISGTLQNPSNLVTHVSETEATPKFNVSYHFSPHSMIYLQAAEGYRIGQSNLDRLDVISGQIIPPSSAPDKLWNYEIGEKSTFYGGHLLINASAFYIDWQNIQLDEQTSGAGINYIGNAGHAVIKGLELEVKVRPVTEWELGGSASLYDTRLMSVASNVNAKKGDRLPGSAPLNLVLFAQYTHPLANGASVFARVDGRYVGREYSELHNDTALVYGRYGALNLRAGVKWDRYSFTGFVENALDGDGKTSAFTSLTVPVAIRQRPVTFGLTLNAKL